MSLRARDVFRESLSILIMGACVLVARASFADHYRVPSGSMEPTVAVGDQVCVNKLAYGLRVPASQAYALHGREPARGDVVVLDSPTDSEVLLKRVVARPGDLVAVTNGVVSINGAISPTRVAEGTQVEELDGHVHPLKLDFGGGPEFGPARVPAGYYLVLGDNRGNSRDGRYFGWVERGAILGRAVAVCVREGRLTWNPL
ncbi:MAG TPA: signal peptidase I [Polyangiaceae bacterium]|jgi:signal peptidase I|nr:signal peptidase I [Polyangiaceae bacterium]